MPAAEFTLDATKVTAFAENILMRPQQLKSRLVDAVMSDLEYQGKGDTWTDDRVGEAEPSKITGELAGRTPEGFLENFRRSGYWDEYELALWLDKSDMLDKLADPTSITMQEMLAGKERSRDRAIMDCFFADVKEGRNGATTVTWNTNQDIAVNDWTFYRGKIDGATAPTGNIGLTTSKLRSAKKKLDDAECIGERFIACSSTDLQNLLTSVETTSSDYNPTTLGRLNALYDGEIDYFMGFKFIRLPSSMFTISSNIADLPCWVKSAVGYKSRTIIAPRIAERPDRRFVKQAYYSFEQSGLRQVDAGVVRIKALQS